jgi:hypothetical protein
MICERCGCTDFSACWDERMDSPCAWAGPGLCTACLTDVEFELATAGKLGSEPRHVILEHVAPSERFFDLSGPEDLVLGQY